MSSIRIPVLLAPSLVLAAGCSTIEEGGTGASAGGTYGLDPPPTEGTYDDGADGTATEGEDPLGPEDFDHCLPGPEGTPYFLGWQIACTASSVSRQFVNPLDMSFVELEDFSGHFGNVCCGGIAPAYEADADCKQLCLEQLCEAARVQHVAWAVDVSNDGMGGDCLDVSNNCGFDFELCKTGVIHEQVGNPGGLFSYFLQVECEASHDQTISPYGTNGGDNWDWIQLPNDPVDDPAVCAPLPPPGPGLPEQAPENEVGEEPGTSVTLQWSIGGGPPDSEQSLDAEVDLAYAVSPCASGDCIALSRLHVTVPDSSHRGFVLENLLLTVEQVAEAAPLAASGDFSFGARALRATLALSVDGTPLVITSYNKGLVRGVALPRAGTMILTNLMFGYEDGIIAADLALNINGTYLRHAPDALVKVVDSPTSCTAPVTFEAASTDLDVDSLTHMWWVPPWFLGTGSLLEATLPPGAYRVYLTSVDSSGRSDSTALEYVRACR